MGSKVWLLSVVSACAVCQLAAQFAVGYSPPTAPWQRLGLYSPPGSIGPSLVDSLYHRDERRGVSGYRGVPTGYAVHEPAIGPPETLHSFLHASKISPQPYPSPFNAQFIVPSRAGGGTNHVLSHVPEPVPSPPCPQTSLHNDPVGLANNFPIPHSVLHTLLNSPYFRGPETSPGYYSSPKLPPLPTFNIGYQPVEGSHFPLANKPLSSH